jgi:hypothetical protein
VSIYVENYKYFNALPKVYLINILQVAEIMSDA